MYCYVSATVAVLCTCDVVPEEAAEVWRYVTVVCLLFYLFISSPWVYLHVVVQLTKKGL